MSNQKYNRIAYVALIMSFQSGVANKMRRLAQSAKDEKIPIDYFWFTTNYQMEDKNLAPLQVENTNDTNPFKVRKWQAEKINELLQKYHRIVIRYPLYDPVLHLFLKDKKRIITEHHTKELDELKLVGDKRYLMEKFMGSLWLKRFGGIIAVTDEIVKYEVNRTKFSGPTHFVPNSIPHISKPKEITQAKPEKIQIIMVANFRPWHGLDDIIEGLEKYKNQASDFELHLVGLVPDEQKAKLNAFENVKLYGHLNYDEIESLYEKMDIGLAGYNLQSKNMDEATSLKVREYFANGLSVVLGYHDPAFPAEFPFKLQTEDFAIPEILEFAKKNRKSKKADIIEQAEPYISSKFVLKKLYDFCIKLN